LLLTLTATVAAVISAANPYWYNQSPNFNSGLFEFCIGGSCTPWRQVSASDMLKDHAQAAAAFFTSGLILTGLLSVMLLGVRAIPRICGCSTNKMGVAVTSAIATVFLLIGWAIGAGMRHELKTSYGSTAQLDSSYGLAIASWCLQLIATVIFFFAKAPNPNSKKLTEFTAIAIALSLLCVVTSAIGLGRPNWYLSATTNFGIMKYCTLPLQTDNGACTYWHTTRNGPWGAAASDLGQAASAFVFAGLVLSAVVLLLLVFAGDSDGEVGTLGNMLRANSKTIIVPLSAVTTAFLVVGWACGAGMKHKLDNNGADASIEYAYALTIVSWGVQLLLTVLLAIRKPTPADDPVLVGV